MRSHEERKSSKERRRTSDVDNTSHIPRKLSKYEEVVSSANINVGKDEVRGVDVFSSYICISCGDYGDYKILGKGGESRW